MNQRLQKKCFIAAAGLHLTLLLVCFFGSGFLASNPKSENRPLIDFVPLKTIDSALAGGGNPNANPTPPAPKPPAEKPQPPAPQPEKTVVQPPKPATEKAESKASKSDFVLKPTTRRNNTTTVKPKPTQDPESDAQAKANAERRKLAANLARNIRENVSGSTTIELRGPGSGGVPYANFLDGVKKVYNDAWIVPDGITDDEAMATASVTIGRDGMVLDARITHSSGSTLTDQSVEMVLRRVTRAVPLPDEAKENQRTVTIKFSVKAKRGLG